MNKLILTLACIIGIGSTNVSAQIPNLEDLKRENERDFVPYGAKKDSNRELGIESDIKTILKDQIDEGLISCVKSEKDFYKEVYQKDKEPEERNPALVFVYTTEEGNRVFFDNVKREARAFGKLAEGYGKKIRLIVCADKYFPREEGKSSPQREEGEKMIFSERLLKSTISAIAMYSTYDFLKGETSQNNDGIIKMIDAFQIVPSDIPILKRARDLEIWVDANLSPTYGSPPADCYRYLSTNEINKIPTKK